MYKRFSKKILSTRLRDTREARGLSQQELDARAGMPIGTTTHFEVGRRLPTLFNVAKIADALSVSVDYLMGRIDDPKTVGPEYEDVFHALETFDAEERRQVLAFIDYLSVRPKSGEAKAE